MLGKVQLLHDFQNKTSGIIKEGDFHDIERTRFKGQSMEAFHKFFPPFAEPVFVWYHIYERPELASETCQFSSV